jgi:hypothetical protein
MPLCNIIDRRKRPYRFLKINAVVEPTCHDNPCVDADYAERGYVGIGYDEQEHGSLAAAVVWAQSFDHAVTLYLYDEDGGIYPSGKVRATIPA